MDRSAAISAQEAATDNSDRRRESSSAGAGPPQVNGSEPDSGVSAPHAAINRVVEQLSAAATEAPASGATGDVLQTVAPEPTAADILRNIGQRFVEARKLNKPEAWRQLQADIMTNLSSLCPFVLPLKDGLTACREIEDFCKGSTGQTGKSNEELLREFLQGKGELAQTQPLVELAEESDTIAAAETVS
jgi:hypothetical protein